MTALPDERGQRPGRAVPLVPVQPRRPPTRRCSDPPPPSPSAPRRATPGHAGRAGRGGGAGVAVMRGGGRPRRRARASTATTRARSGSSTAPRAEPAAAHPAARRGRPALVRALDDRRAARGAAARPGHRAVRLGGARGGPRRTRPARPGRVPAPHHASAWPTSSPRWPASTGVFLRPRRGLIRAALGLAAGARRAAHRGGEHGLLAALRAAAWPTTRTRTWLRQLLSPSLVMLAGRAPARAGLRAPRGDARGVREPAARGRGQPHLPDGRDPAHRLARGRRDGRGAEPLPAA